MYGFGYDSISDTYKVVVVFSDLTHDDLTIDELMNEVNREVMVHTLGTDSWKNVSEFPFAFVSYCQYGQHVTGTINWLIFAGINRVIASFDLGKECYREVLLPDDSSKVDNNKLLLSVFRDCLCMISGEDVWVMKEYGNKESWTKLFTISSMRDPRASSYPFIWPIRVFEDEQVLMIYREDERWGYISYNYKNDTSKFLDFEITRQDI
ncbi:F-box/kelch-repeat protein At3g23880-like [Trifolium pratense]|uniref:F-box/kelch-repeat protein At3g23880-like n=1 Tax=Trifolium pratense TaxID=57577 RepID=UPI001E6973A5|nr:F-box/kelch-repeat protein At3g23880-like [Trifolium pratense]